MRTRLSVLVLALALPAAAAAGEDFLMGSVVKSDRWKMDRANDRELFDGDVSFRNPRYTLKADHAAYSRRTKVWDIYGSVYTLRRFDDGSRVEVDCDRSVYSEGLEEARLRRGALPVRMKYTAPDGRVLRGLSDRADAANAAGRIDFAGAFTLSTENLDIHAEKGSYDNAERSFLIHDSTPAAVGTREGYDFAINADSIKLFRDSRDIKFTDRVSGWVKDVPPAAAKQERR